MAGDSVFALDRQQDPQPCDASRALGHLAALASRLCPAPLAEAPPFMDIALIGCGAQDAEKALLLLARGSALRLVDPDSGRLQDLLRRIALEQEYALWAGEISVDERERQWRAITCYSELAAAEDADLALWADHISAPRHADTDGATLMHLRFKGGAGGASGCLVLRGRLAELTMPQSGSLRQLQDIAQFLRELGFCPMPISPLAKDRAISARLAAKIVDVLLRLRSYGCDQHSLRKALDPVGLPALQWDDGDLLADPPLDAAEIRKYYLNEIVCFGRDLLRQGYLTQLDALDLIAVHALGQPPQSGGPIYQARALGLCAPEILKPIRSRKSPRSGRARKSPAPQD